MGERSRTYTATEEEAWCSAETLRFKLVIHSRALVWKLLVKVRYVGSVCTDRGFQIYVVADPKHIWYGRCVFQRGREKGPLYGSRSRYSFAATAAMLIGRLSKPDMQRMWKFAESLDLEELTELDMRADCPEWLTEREYKFFW